MKTFLSILVALCLQPVFSQNIWEPVPFPDTLYPQTVSAESGEFLFVTAQGTDGWVYLFKSNNNGVSWERLKLKTEYFNKFYTIHYTDEGVLFLGTRFFILRSLYNGDSFDTVYRNSDQQDLIYKIKSFNGGVYALGHSKIVRSLDNGTTWDTVYRSNAPHQYVMDLEVGPNGEMYAVCYDLDSVESGFYRSFDHGLHWEHTGITDRGIEAIGRNASGTLIVGGKDLDGIYRSTDQGDTWNKVSDITGTTIASFNGCFIAGSNLDDFSGGCWISHDGGNDWSDLSDTLMNPLIHQISLSSSNYVYLQCNYFAGKPQLFRSVNPILSTDKPNALPELSLFPNPAKKKVLIKNRTPKQVSYATLYTLQGQKIQWGAVLNGMIDVSAIPPGVYVVELVVGHRLIRRKLIIR